MIFLPPCLSPQPVLELPSGFHRIHVNCLIDFYRWVLKLRCRTLHLNKINTFCQLWHRDSSLHTHSMDWELLSSCPLAVSIPCFLTFVILINMFILSSSTRQLIKLLGRILRQGWGRNILWQTTKDVFPNPLWVH
jgi:hypothetical protein